MSTFKTHCPVVKRTTETFTEFVTVGGERRRMTFEKDIVWIQESETKRLFRHGGEVLKEGSTTTDYYGYLTSFRDENESSERSMQFYGITPESSLELVLMTTIRLSPATETAETLEHNRKKLPDYKAQYADVPNDWRQEVVADGETLWPYLQPIKLAQEVVWSSKNTPEQNEALEQEFTRKWQVSPEARETASA
ncbi:hypothetical protein F6X40_35440 [Paraburkholderia sp. UCT31]|uniref:hypothetical protein n=1 Tax=Paraburkholderia sp. UCT31 TaxID=2615209 RepID=UPI00165588B8|nr:hypothetical protein [Paraburkholderia sp. UCT31]MBC8741844.1 hypothetical protein [Paraburkholderia sp. UCT31]